MASYYRMASGDPMYEIIGDVIGEIDVVRDGDFEIGALFHGPIGRWFRRRISKPIGRTIKNVTRPIGRIPGVKQVTGAVSSAVREYGDIMLTPERIAAGAVAGLVTGGTKGLARGVKREAMVTARESRRYVQNPIVRYGTKGAALLFPPLVPAAAGIEAANQAIKAIKSKDPIAAAAALATVVNTADLANAGDEDALRAIKTIKAVKDGAVQVKDYARKAQDIMGIKFNLPKGVTKNKAVAVAHTLLSKAKAGNAVAQSVVKQTIAAAKAPGAPKGVVAGAKVLAIVHKAQQVVAKPAIRAGLARTVGSYRKAMRASKGKSYTGAYLVDATGRVFKGNFAAK